MSHATKYVYSMTFQVILVTACQRSSEWNVFSRLCLFVCPQGGSHVIITHDALDLTVQGPPWHVQTGSTWT